MSKLNKKYQNGCHLKTESQNYQIFDVHILGTYLYQMWSFYVLTMWLRGLYTDNDTDADSDTDPKNYGQSMIV